MACAEERLRVSRGTAINNTFSDYGNRRFYEFGEHDEERDRVRVKLAKATRLFNAAIASKQTGIAFERALDVTYWQGRARKVGL